MKTNLKRITKRSLALILGILMLFSTLMVGSISTANATTLTGGQIIYLNGGGDSLWNKANAWFAAYFYGGSSDKKWVKMTQQSGNYYYVEVPSGNWNNVIFVRKNPDNTTLDTWANKWNQTEDLTLSGSNNLYTISDWGSDKSPGSWGKYQPTTTATLSASSATVETNKNVTLNPGIGDTTYNAYNSVSYSISPSSGASITGNTFTATTADTYTVTATVTYNAKGFTNITKTADATVDITVNAAQPTTYTGLSVDKTGSGTVKISADNCTIGGSVNITATPATGYKFAGWTATNGTLGSASSANTTFTPTANNAKATATFTENKYNITVKADGTTETTKSVGIDTSATITAVDKDGFKFAGWEKTGNVTIADASAKETTITATGTGTVTATYTEITYARLYYSNPNNWSSVYAYIWKNSNGSFETAWHGRPMSSETINDVPYYYIEFDSSIGYDRIIFNNNDNQQTGTVEFDSSKYGMYWDGDSWETLPTNKPLLNITNGTTDTNGSIEGFYSDSGYTNAITQAREGDRVYVKVTPNTGYKLNTLTAGTTDIKTNKYFDMPSSAVTVTATFAEDTSTSYSLVFDTGSTSSYPFEKKSGQTALSIGYAEVTLNRGTKYTFKIHSSTSNSDYVYSSKITSANSDQALNFTSGTQSCEITPSVTGTYKFKWDYTGDTRALTVTFPTYKATISADPSEGGSVDYAEITGATTVTATPKTGYVFDGWVTNDDSKVEVADTDSASTTITPLAEGGTVTAKFARAYSVTVTGADCSSTPADLSKVKEGTAVKITLPSGAGYNFSVNVSGVTNYKFENREVSFTMPASNVTITVSATYDITVNATNGTASVSKTPAAANEEITVNTNPADGYELNAITVTGATVTNNKFTMPAKPVTVTVTFKETKHTVKIANNVDSTTSTKQVGKINAVDISAEAITGYNFSKWEVVSGTATITAPTSANTSVKASTDATIKAVYTENLSTNFTLFGSWNWDNGASFEKAPGQSTSNIAYATVSLAKDQTYTFKINDGTSWYGNNGTINKDTVFAESSSNWWDFVSGGKDCTIVADAAGEYKFALDVSNKRLKVIYPTAYSEITVSSLKLADNEDVNVNPKATVVMGAFDAHPGDSTKYKPVVKVKDSLGNVNTFYGAVVNASAITAGEQYTFAPIEITGLSKGSYTVTAEIIGYNDSDTQVAYGASAEKAMDYGCYYKETAYTGDVAWVDAVPSYKGGDKATLIKWSKYKSGSNDENTRLDKVGDKVRYTFYLPSGVNMSAVTIYHNFSSLTINNQTITSGNSYDSFTVNTDYDANINGNVDCKVKFMKGSQNSTQLYLNTKNSDGTAYDLPMQKHPVNDNDATAQAYKESVTCVGTEVAVDQTGAVTTGTLKKFKGRGNSSWKASCELFGKYAFNMTLDKSANLFGLAGDNKNGNTKYSLLANNVDEAQVRNSYIYKLAKELGFEYFPNFQMADVYDNGVYMGSYLICQKVELGKKGMITEPEIKYDDPVDSAGKKIPFTTATGTHDDCEYQYSSNRVDSTNYNSGGTYLMEFELPDRYNAEASWFISKKGQPIVVASPENASQNEMKFIIEKWNTVEAAVYAGNLNSIRDKIDVESFAKMYLIQELSKNLDACSTSYNILYKSAEDKFYAEPVWDFDWTLGQYDNDPKSIVGNHDDVDKKHSNYYGFFARYKGMSGKSTTDYDFEAQLCQNASFWADVQTIWKNEFYSVATAQNTYLTNTYIPGIKDTILMNENRWGFIANNLSGSWGTKDTGSDFNAVTNATTKWITDRLTWLNGKITPTMYTVSAGEGATMTYMDNMGNGKLNAYTQFAEGTRLTFTAARQPGMEFKGWSTNGKDVVDSLGKNLTMTVTVNGEATYTPIFAMTYEVRTTPVTYYVDMHGDSNLVPTINFADGDTLALTQIGSSTVYSGTYDTKYYVDNNKKFVDIATKISTISAGGKNLALTSANALTKKCLETGEVWIEATQSIKDAQATNNSTPAKGAIEEDITSRRVYFTNNKNWSGTISAYCWNSNKQGYVQWPGESMTLAGTNGQGQSVYYYDIPAGYDNFIFNGSNNQTNDISFAETYSTIGDNSYYMTGDKTVGITASKSPVFTKYTKTLEMYLDDTNTYNIKPVGIDKLITAGKVTYNVTNGSSASVDTNGNVTAHSTGTTTVTITATGSNGDTFSKTTTIKVIDRPVIATPAYAIMSYQSNTSSFQAVGGTLGTLTTKLAGSAYNGATTGGIIDTKNNTVKYAIADPTVTAYADLAVTVTAPSTGNKNYVFVDWTKNNTTISGATETLTVTLNTASTDKYIVTYQLNSVQVVFTYNFVDYDTSKGYEYVEGGPTKPASYKTAPKTVHASAIQPAEDGYGYDVTEELQNAAETNMPNIISNYFRYSLDKTKVSAPTMVDGIYYVTAEMTNTARTYEVSVNGTKVGDYTFQKEVVLKPSDFKVPASETGYVWKLDGQKTPISDKEVYTLKVAGDTKLTVKASDGTEKIKNLSTINATFHEIKTNNNKNYVGQNFYIQNFYRQNDPVYDENGNEVAGATDKTFEGAGVLSYNATYDSTTKTYKPVSATVRNFDYTNKTSLLGVARNIGVEATGNSASNSIHTASGLNYSFVKGSDTVDNVTGQTFMKYSQTQGCYSYFYQAITEQSKLYRSQYYVVYSYYVYSYKVKNEQGIEETKYTYVMSDQYATAKVYATESN